MTNVQVIVAHGRVVSVRLSGTPSQADTTTTVANTETAATETATAEPKEPSALGLDPKELIAGLAAFLALYLLMRYVFYPKVHGDMTARVDHVKNTLAESDSIRDAAHNEVADYQAELAKIREEGAARVEAARLKVESERAEKMASLNIRIGQHRNEATTAADAAKAGMSDQVVSAASDVASQVASMVLGKAPDAVVVKAAVTSLMGSVK